MTVTDAVIGVVVLLLALFIGVPVFIVGTVGRRFKKESEREW